MIPLTDPVPLRTTVAWGEYRDVRALPIGYGRVVVEPVPYNAQGTVFLLLDHPIISVEQVSRGAEKERSFTWQNRLDSTGHAAAFLELAEPLESDLLAVEVVGRIHPRLGGSITNPGDVLWDLLANIAGLPFEWSEFADFRAECRNAGIEVGGVIDDADRTLRSYVQEIADSVGAVWSGGFPGFARFYPELS